MESDFRDDLLAHYAEKIPVCVVVVIKSRSMRTGWYCLTSVTMNEIIQEVYPRPNSLLLLFQRQGIFPKNPFAFIGTKFLTLSRSQLLISDLV